MTDASELDGKLKLLRDVCNDLKEHSPSALRNILQEYNDFINVENGNLSTNTSKVDVYCQTENHTEGNAWNIENITKDVTAIAEKVTLETGFSYDENSGWYFDQNTSCYYNSNYRLYYYAANQSYYYYDEETKGLKFHSSLPSQTNESCTVNDDCLKTAETSDLLTKTENFTTVVKPNDDKEDGEYSASDEEITKTPNPSVIEATHTIFEPGNSKYLAPCIRVIVKSSSIPGLCCGTLFIVTCTGGTLGREGNHDVLIPDHLVSKIHSKFQYVHRDGVYFYQLIDLGSKNGTFVNGKRLSDALVQSEPITITHGSIITVGHTDLLCHIHPYNETCPDCAPLINVGKENNNSIESSVTLKERHKLEEALIRKKFGISNYYIPKLPEGYENRAEVRRKQVGSSHHSEKTDSASINEPISKKNKGYALLSKMGWKEGDSLGIRNEGATLEPIQVLERDSKLKSGLGCETFYQETESKKESTAMKTLERFKQIK